MAALVICPKASVLPFFPPKRTAFLKASSIRGAMQVLKRMFRSWKHILLAGERLAAVLCVLTWEQVPLNIGDVPS